MTDESTTSGNPKRSRSDVSFQTKD